MLILLEVNNSGEGTKKDKIKKSYLFWDLFVFPPEDKVIIDRR